MEESTERDGNSPDSNAKARESGELDKILEATLQDTPKEKRREIVDLLHRSMERYYSGPLPPPEMLREYEEVLPNAAERIMTMAEAEQGHRHRWEKQALSIENRASAISIAGGVIIALTLVAGAFWSVHLGQRWIAALFLGGPAIALVANLLNARRLVGNENSRHLPGPTGNTPNHSGTATAERRDSKRARRRKR